MKYSIVLPCRNEEKAIGYCIDKINKVMQSNSISDYEIVVSDSSIDRSPLIALEKGARVIKHNLEGYGIAYLEGFSAAKGDFLICADADGSYDFNEMPKFISSLEKGNEFVLGNRFSGKMNKKAMPFFHRYIGNPLLTKILTFFFGIKIKDAHCGFRAIKRSVLSKLKLRTIGMEFASEMIVKAAKQKLKIAEVPISYHNRIGKSKLNSFVDGWRHLRFMLLYSPFFLFFLPGLFLFLLGGFVMVSYLIVSSFEIYYLVLFICSLLIISGYQLIIFAVFAKTYAITHLGDKPVLKNLYKYLTIENASIFGIIFILIGLFVYSYLFLNVSEGNIDWANDVTASIFAMTFILLGLQTVFSSFMLSILGIKES